MIKMKTGVTVGRFVACITATAAVILVATSLSVRSKEPAKLMEHPSSIERREVTGAPMASPDFWKTVNLTEKAIPESIKKLAHNVHVSSNHINVMGVETFYREAKPPEGIQESGVVVLLLHGAAFKSKTWLDLATIHLLAAMGHVVIAIDLPGYGETRAVVAGNRGEYLNNLVTELKLTAPVIVSPSMSGGFSIPYLIKYHDLIGGYVPVAPVGTRAIVSKASEIKVPTLILYGSKDQGLGHQSRDDLKAIATSQVVEIPDAGHPAYLSQPELFHTLLYNFIENIRAFRSKA
ncbi:putative protein-lysine deacylase ABHD14B isoform X2 [Oratosquilla oratoria]